MALQEKRQLEKECLCVCHRNRGRECESERERECVRERESLHECMCFCLSKRHKDRGNDIKSDIGPKRKRDSQICRHDLYNREMHECGKRWNVKERANVCERECMRDRLRLHVCMCLRKRKRNVESVRREGM